MVANSAVRRWLIDLASNHFAQYPQYKDYHKDWGLALVNETLKFKGGNVPAGSIVLVKIETRMFGGLGGTILEFERYHHCSVDIDYLGKLTLIPE